MKDKINISELLRDCPQGMELDCTMYDNVYFNKIIEDTILLIECYTIYDGFRNSVYFTEFGEFNSHRNAKCVIFPKGETTWEGFQPPFKDGDIIFTRTEVENHWVSIFKRNIDEKCETYVDLNIEENYFVDDSRCLCPISEIIYQRLATDGEKQKLFDVIREKGYTWNVNDKKLEKTHKCVFDIKTLKPFDRVLVRDVNNDYWNVNLFGSYFIGWNSPFVCAGKEGYRQCVPYEGNEHLLGTTNDCDEFYKTW